MAAPNFGAAQSHGTNFTSGLWSIRWDIASPNFLSALGLLRLLPIPFHTPLSLYTELPYQPELTMEAFIVLAFVLAALFSTVYAHNITHSTITATVTKTVYHTVTTSINVATLPSSAPNGTAFGSSASADYDPSFELKSMAVETIEFTSTVFSTEVDGVVVTSLSTIVAPVTSTSTELHGVTSTSTEFQEVTSTTTKHAGTTITTTSVVVSASTPSVAASSSSISVEQNIAQMFGLNGSEHVQANRWLVFSVVVLGVAHYLFFAHH